MWHWILTALQESRLQLLLSYTNCLIQAKNLALLAGGGQYIRVVTGSIAVRTQCGLINTIAGIEHSFPLCLHFYFLSAGEQRRCTSQVSQPEHLCLLFLLLNSLIEDKIIPETGPWDVSEGAEAARSMLIEAVGSKQHGHHHTARAFQMQRKTLKVLETKKKRYSWISQRKGSLLGKVSQQTFFSDLWHSFGKVALPLYSFACTKLRCIWMLTLPCDRMEKSFLPHTAACVRGVFCNYCSKKQEKKKKGKKNESFQSAWHPYWWKVLFCSALFLKNKSKNEFHLSFSLDFALLHLFISILSGLIRQLRFLYFPAGSINQISTFQTASPAFHELECKRHCYKLSLNLAGSKTHGKHEKGRMRSCLNLE